MSNWIETEKGLLKTFAFEDQAARAAFISTVGIISDTINHHASFQELDTAGLEVCIITHDENRITNKDHELAELIDQI
jgi:4a-hydroxytetrahydrobiopterin dehydratase